MIIECINCNKKFNVNSELIPEYGRNIQCGSCGHVWFFKKNQQNEFYKPIIDKKVEINPKNIRNKSKIKVEKSKKKSVAIFKKENNSINQNNMSALVKYENKSSFTFSNLLSYILVTIISFISLIIVLDTFKSPLYNVYPNLELILFNLFETLKDIQLFIKDLI